MIKGIKNNEKYTPAWALCASNVVLKEKRLNQVVNRYLSSVGLTKLAL